MVLVLLDEDGTENGAVFVRTDIVQTSDGTESSNELNIVSMIYANNK